MSEIDHVRAAPLVRGLYLEAAHSPLALAASSAPAPSGAPSVDLSGFFDGTSDEAAAAGALKTAFQKRATSAGELPACVEVRNGKARTTYWPGKDLDEARGRGAAGGGGAWPVPSRTAVPAGSALGRSTVVEGRIALVTGGAQGFGKEIVRGLAASGALVFVADMNVPGAESLAGSLNSAAGRTVALPIPMNVADEDSVAEVFRSVAAAAGGIDLVVSNAGVLRAGSVLDQDAGVFRFVTEVNYTGFFLVAKHAGLLLRRQRIAAPAWRTDIVQVNSKSGLQGSNRNGAYAGSKFGGLGLVQSFALELVEYGVKVNAICPGNFFDGPLWSDPESGLFVQYLRSGKVPGARTLADVKAFYEAKVPMGRGCEGPDVMRALYYLVEQEYETGQALPVTGGQVMLN